MISFDDLSDFRRTVAAYNEQLMQLYRRQTPAAPIPEETPPPQPAAPPEEDPTEEASPLPGEALSEVLATPASASESGREMSTGYLQFFATTAGQSEPVPRAHITVTQDGALIATAFTDISGLSPVLSLPAVDRRYSLEPGNETPYTLYAASVTADGYYTQQFTALQLYGGTAALQPVVLVPLPVGTAAGSTDVDGQPPDL